MVEDMEEEILGVQNIRLDTFHTNLEEVYETKGWAQLLKFDAKIDDLEIEKHVREEYIN